MKNSTGPGVGKIIGRFFAIVGVTLLALVILVVGAVAVLTLGPSSRAKQLFVLSTGETSAIYWIPGVFLSDEEVDAIRHPQQPTVSAPEAKKVTVPEDPLPFTELRLYSAKDEPLPEEPKQAEPETPEVSTEQQEDTVTIVDIRGATYKGKLMIVTDPSRVVVGTLDKYGVSSGLYLDDFVAKYNAVGGTNAGGFYDPDGRGNGGTPDGLVMKDGEIMWGLKGSYYNNVIGFDADHVLHVGGLTGQQALDLGLISAVSFEPGPVLIKDGVKNTGLGGGVNPRTCIGQRKDGTVLLLVVEGRRADTLGATYDDLADIMEEYGAVNAANLDGGSSSLMIYDGGNATRVANFIGSRRLATAILVLESGEGN